MFSRLFILLTAVVVTVNAQSNAPSLEVCTNECIANLAAMDGCASFGSHTSFFSTNLTCLCGNPQFCQVDITLQSLECSAGADGSTTGPPDGCALECVENSDFPDACISFYNSDITWSCNSPQFHADVILQALDCSAGGLTTQTSATPSPVTSTSTNIIFVTSTISSAASAPVSIAPATSSKSNTADIAGGVVGGVVSLGLIVGLITYIMVLRRNVRSRPSGPNAPAYNVADAPGKDA